MRDLLLQEQADVAVADVAGGVPFAGRGEQVLPGAFCHNDHRVPVACDPLAQGAQQAGKGERALRIRHMLT